MGILGEIFSKIQLNGVHGIEFQGARHPVGNGLGDAKKADKLKAALNKAYREVMHPQKVSGRRNRAKGLDFERLMVGKLKEIFPDAKRHLEFQAEEAHGVDIDNTDQYLFQCKKLKTYAPISTICEIECARELGEVPILITAGDGLPPMAVLHFEDLLELLRSTK